MKLYTAAQMKEIDRIAIQERGIPSTLLMERAATALAREVMALPLRCRGRQGAVAWITYDGREPGEEEKAAFFARRQRSAIVFCGPGNNSGDGVACARLLMKEGWRVKCVLVGRREKMTDDCKEMARRLEEAGGTLEDFHPESWADYAGYDVAVDALFGVGLNSDLRPDAVEAVRIMNAARWTVSADIPSGIHADTGAVMGRAVKAHVTVTFSGAKVGHFVGPGAVHSGRVVVADIGIPADLMNGAECTVHAAERPVLPRRRRDSHKGDFGKLFILAGSRGYTGAAALCAQSAVRGGAGLVTVAVPEDIYPIIAAKCDEAMVWPLPREVFAVVEKAKTCDVAVIGPGLGQSQRAEALVLALLTEFEGPVLVDADGLNILSRHINILDKRRGVTVLTPHDGEFARLAGCGLPIIHRLETARQFAVDHRCILVLKGHNTITAAPTGRCMVNTTGNPGMARGGSGDALAGLMGALMAQKRLGGDTPAHAVWLHGRAGDLAAAEKGEYGMTVTDLVGQIPYAMKECEEEG